MSEDLNLCGSFYKVSERSHNQVPGEVKNVFKAKDNDFGCGYGGGILLVLII